MWTFRKTSVSSEIGLTHRGCYILLNAYIVLYKSVAFTVSEHVKVEMSLCTAWKLNVGLQIKLGIFLDSMLAGGEGSTSRHGVGAQLPTE